MLLTNEKIYLYKKALNEAFLNDNHYYPAKVNFYIQKNLKRLNDCVEEIENARNDTIRYYGKQEEDGQYKVPYDKIAQANKELEELLKVEQDLNIYMIKLQDIENLEFTSSQMEALLFMIEE